MSCCMLWPAAVHRRNCIKGLWSELCCELSMMWKLSQDRVAAFPSDCCREQSNNRLTLRNSHFAELFAKSCTMAHFLAHCCFHVAPVPAHLFKNNCTSQANRSAIGVHVMIILFHQCVSTLAGPAPSPQPPSAERKQRAHHVVLPCRCRSGRTRQQTRHRWPGLRRLSPCGLQVNDAGLVVSVRLPLSSMTVSTGHYTFCHRPCCGQYPERSFNLS
jgi:hypothetical protein